MVILWQKHPSVKTRMTDLEGKVKHLENRYQKVSEVDDMPKTAVAVATLVPPPIGVAPPPPVLASVPAAPKIGKVIPKEPGMSCKITNKIYYYIGYVLNTL